jgi:plasmid stabilization system protein ParE
MDYDVQLTEDAEYDLDNYLSYLMFVKKSEQASKNFLEDFEETKNALWQVAGSLKLCENSRLRTEGYRRINFLSHRYFMLYRVVNDVAIVEHIFHELQDFENKMN